MKSSEMAVAIKLIGLAFNRIWADWVNQVLISLAMVLASLSVIFAGPALMGVCAASADLADGVRTGIAGWWAGFKRYFWQGLTWGVVNLALGIVFLISLWFYTEIATAWAPLLAVLLIFFGIFWVDVQFYTPGYLIAQEEKSLWLAWKNSLLTVLATPLMTLILGTFAMVITLLSVGLLLPILLGTGPLLGMLSVLAVRDRFAAYLGRNDEYND
jgi:hypothetical protein